MDLILKVYLAVVFAILFLGIWLSLPHHTSPRFLGLNNTHINTTTCRYTWLGGTDYDSFVGNLTVDHVDVGHPVPGSVIHVGRCDAVVRMYMKDVKSYVQLYPQAGGI